MTNRQITLDHPRRIQRRRNKGWRAPDRAVYIGRGTRWGNPARLVHQGDGWAVEHIGSGALVGTFSKPEARRYAIELYRHHLKTNPEMLAALRDDLAGRDLMCWCPLPAPGEPDECHGAVLLELANEAAEQ